MNLSVRVQIIASVCPLWFAQAQSVNDMEFVLRDAAYLGNIPKITTLLDEFCQPGKLFNIDAAPTVRTSIFRYYLQLLAITLLAITQGGWTALHQAASYGRVEVVKLLLERGANPRAKTDVGTIYHDDFE